MDRLAQDNTKLKKIVAFLWLIRITVIIPILLASICALMICKINILSSQGISLIFIPLLLASSGFILNDILDIEKDRINRPFRPIPSNSISIVAAYIFFLLFLLTELALILFNHTIELQILFFSATIITLMYSVINKYNGVLGNFITSCLSSLPWIGAGLSSDHINLIAIPAIASFCFVFSREILLDIADYTGDKKQGFVSLPIIFGIPKAISISFSITLISNILLIYGLIHNYNYIFFILFTLGFIIPTLVILISLLKQNYLKYIYLFCHLGKAQFIIGILCWWSTIN